MIRKLLWVLVLALVGVALALPPAGPREPARILLFGPFVELAAEIQWLRFHVATRRGEGARALELAESALALDPRAGAGWEALASHLVFDRASREREPELRRRRAWFEAGLAVLRRGSARARRPGELELFLGLVLADKALNDPELDPGGAEALLAAAHAAFARAGALGDARAAALVDQPRAGTERAPGLEREAE